MVDIQNKTEKAWNSPLFEQKLLLTNFLEKIKKALLTEIYNYRKQKFT